MRCVPTTKIVTLNQLGPYFNLDRVKAVGSSPIEIINQYSTNPLYIKGLVLFIYPET